MAKPRGILILFLLAFASLGLAQEASQAPVEVPSETQANYVVKKVAPVYPPLARQARIQGTVVLRLIISKTGDVAHLQLISGHPMLAPAVIEAVKQWKYQPYQVDGKPVDVATSVRLNFALTGKSMVEGVVGDTPGGVPLLPLVSNGSVVRRSEPVMRALRNQKIDPLYPPQAIDARIEGTVVLDAHINKDGEVEAVTLISGHPILAPAAIEAVKQWKYQPYLLNGAPVEVETTVSVDFSLSRENPPDGTVSDTVSQRVRVASGIESGLLVRKVAPSYPVEAREQGIQGTVLLNAIIDEEGNISDLELISGDPTLAQAAIDAVKQWKYRPYLLNGNPVQVETHIQVNFTLQN